MPQERRPARTRLLVTGVGGDFGQGFVKALRLGSRAMELHGCDMESRGIGAAFVDSFHVVPPASEGDAYVAAIEKICAKLHIDAVIPGSPVEIEALGRLGSTPALPSGVPVVCQPVSYRDIYNDKLHCYRALEGKVELAPYADGADPEAVRQFVEAHGFPLVVKQRRGQGSMQLHIVNGPAELAPALNSTPDPVIQGFIDDRGGEYSVGVFSANGGRTAIAFHRRLGRTGSSWFGETVDDGEILDYCRAIARASKLRGSANIQVRRSSKGIRLLEVNARFSSLAPARAYAGFRDIEWSVDMALGRVPELPAACYRRFRFQRFIHEMIDDGAGFALVPQWSSGFPWTPMRPWRRLLFDGVKRTVDIVGAIVGLVLLAPVMLCLALAVLVAMGRPIFYLRRRPGRHGKPFTPLKFRTMREGETPPAERMTPLGEFLRATSLDELPQFWNVLVGDMSLVGPRPLMLQYLDRYTREQHRRHEVRPGITGWAQVNGRNALSWEERFRLDVWYVDHRSIALDLKILMLTVAKVFSRAGVAPVDSGIEAEFMGSPPEAGRTP